jgi:hypothetical protein
MKGKLRLLGVGVLAVVTVGAVAVVDASATTSGHFTTQSSDHHVVFRGTAIHPGTHTLTIQRTVNGTASGSPIKCTHIHYFSTRTGWFVTLFPVIWFKPTYTDCSTEGESPHNVLIDVPGPCGENAYEMTSGGSGTVHANCSITLTHPNCRIVLPAQTLSGVSYSATTRNGRAALTANLNLQGITGHFESGFCVFLGTNQTFHMQGSILIWAEDAGGNPVGITHTP